MRAAQCFAWLLLATLHAAPALGETAPSLERIDRTVAVPRGGPVFTAPTADALSAGRLRAGATVELLAVTTQRDWFQLRLPDNTTLAYMPAERLLPYDLDTGAGATSAQPAATLNGMAQVLDTATLRVGGRIVALDGVEGAGDAYARALQAFIDGNGGTVACREVPGGRFSCALPNGVDVAMAALVNGSALPAPGAAEPFQRQQAAAASARRGLWSGAVGARPLPAGNVPPPPRQDRLAQSTAGAWTAYRAATDKDGSRACGIVTAWRGATASLTVLFVGLHGQRVVTVALRDAGWDVPARLAAPGTLVLDGMPVPMQWTGLAPNDTTVLAGTPGSPGGLAPLLDAMAKGRTLFAATPMGRTGSLTLAGAKPAVGAFLSCVGWAAGASPPARQ